VFSNVNALLQEVQLADLLAELLHLLAELVGQLEQLHDVLLLQVDVVGQVVQLAIVLLVGCLEVRYLEGQLGVILGGRSDRFEKIIHKQKDTQPIIPF